MDYIVMFNEIQNVLQMHCDGKDLLCTNERNTNGLVFDEICAFLPHYNRKDIKKILNIRNDVFKYDSLTSRWGILPECVGMIRRAIMKRKNKMAKVYKDKKLSRFIPINEYRKILFCREEDFNKIIDRCEMLGNCSEENILVEPSIMWDVVYYSGDDSFESNIRCIRAANKIEGGICIVGGEGAEYTFCIKGKSTFKKDDSIVADQSLPHQTDISPEYISRHEHTKNKMSASPRTANSKRDFKQVETSRSSQHVPMHMSNAQYITYVSIDPEIYKNNYKKSGTNVGSVKRHCTGNCSTCTRDECIEEI